MNRSPVPLIVALFVAGLRAVAAEPGATDPRTGEFFESRVRPVLAARCYECHQADSKSETTLRLDSLAGMLAGGDLGPAIKPGDAKASLLVRAINHGDVVEMPPKTKLPAREIEDLTAWVEAGAHWPDAAAQANARSAHGDKFVISDSDRAYWAFQPPADPPVPAVRNGEWPHNSIDHFVLAGLEAQGLAPARPADRRTLIRRLSFDLTGLPPTIEEVDAFLADTSNDALEQVVDRLLASPRYGERWGRRWLDVARYADSNGMDENMAMAHAWRYRDWVIAAFNRDMPYDQFVVEQLAGDLLPSVDLPTDAARLVATGFLVLGPKMLAEDDPLKMQMDIVDEQVDTIGRTFLGLTLGCARCHDHKFDPISTGDYYALAGIFKSTKTMQHHQVVAMWSERPLGTPEEIERLTRYEQALVKVNDEIAAAGKLVADPPDRRNGFGERLLALGPWKQARDKLEALKKTLVDLDKSAPDVPRAIAVDELRPENLRVHLRGSHLTLGDEMPRGFPRVLVGDEQSPIGPKTSGRLELARWLTRAENPLAARVMVNRIWQGHFGEGLVRSPDNFGRLGQQPDNRPLLDWLARRFVESGWSTKAMHRLMVLSSAYQMSTAYDERAAAADPENRLLWRMNRRRLEAEEIRDALFAVSGRLETSMGGTLLSYKNHSYVTSTASANDVNYKSPRRSIYLPVVRSSVYEVFSAFDFADPSTSNGKRPTTTVAPQALFMMNSPLVQSESRALAELIMQNTADDDARVRLAYLRAYNRPAQDQEVARARAFVAAYRSDQAGGNADPAEVNVRTWQALCRVILSANEFIFLE